MNYVSQPGYFNMLNSSSKSDLSKADCFLTVKLIMQQMQQYQRKKGNKHQI